MSPPYICKAICWCTTFISVPLHCFWKHNSQIALAYTKLLLLLPSSLSMSSALPSAQRHTSCHAHGPKTSTLIKAWIVNSSASSAWHTFTLKDYSHLLSLVQLDIHVRAPIQRLDWYYMMVDCQSKNWLTNINLRPHHHQQQAPSTTPHSFRTSQSEHRAESHDSTRLSFLITSEGVFSKWIGEGGIGGNWSIIWRIHISSVHLLPFCFVTHAGLFVRRRKKLKFDCFPLHVMAPLLCVFVSVRKTATTRCD